MKMLIEKIIKIRQSEQRAGACLPNYTDIPLSLQICLFIQAFPHIWQADFQALVSVKTPRDAL